MEEFTKEYFWNTYKTLPEELKEAIFSEKNNQIIYNICSKIGLDEDQTSIVAKYAGRVLMGLLPLKNFSVTLELELNIDENLANQICQEINLAIFKHLRLALNKMEEQKPENQELPDLYQQDVIKTSELNEKENKLTELVNEGKEKAADSSAPEPMDNSIKFPRIKPLNSFTPPKKVSWVNNPVLEKITSKDEKIIDLSDQPMPMGEQVQKTTREFAKTIIQPLEELGKKEPTAEQPAPEPFNTQINIEEVEKIKQELEAPVVAAPEAIVNELPAEPIVKKPLAPAAPEKEKPNFAPAQTAEDLRMSKFDFSKNLLNKKEPNPAESLPAVKSDHFDPYRELPI
ncbi:MAG: hypothetical protein WC470_01785 [Candidatus Paceibacterota bacterium]